PEALGEDDHRWRSSLIVRRSEQTPLNRDHTECIKDTRCHSRRRNAFGFIGAACADGSSAHLVAAELCERPVVALINKDAGVVLIDFKGSPPLKGMRYRDEPFRLRIGKRLEQN